MSRVRSLLACLVLMGLVATVPAAAQEQSLSEEFDVEPDDWALEWNDDESGWVVAGGFLIGRQQTWAYREDPFWERGRLVVSLLDLEGGMNVSVLISETGRYFLELIRDGSWLGMAIGRQVWGEDPVLLAGPEQAKWPPGTFEPQLLEVRFDAVAGSVEAEYALRDVTLEASDDEPLPPGAIGFETLEESTAFIDSVTVEGAAVPVPAALEPLAEVDLTIVDAWSAVDGDTVTLFAEIVNVGEAESPPTQLFADLSGSESTTGVASLAPGESDVVGIDVAVRDSWRGTTLGVRLSVEPVEDEVDTRNNSLGIELAVPALAPTPTMDPGPVPDPGGDAPPWEILLGAGGATAALGSVWLVRRRFRTWRQRRHVKRWENQAEPEERPEPCAPGTWYCHVSQPDVAFRLDTFIYLDVLAFHAGSLAPERAARIEGKPIDHLNEALRCARLGRRRRCDRELEDAARRIAKRALRAVGKRQPEGIGLRGRAAGSQIQFEFTLRRCTSDRRWQNVKKWDRSVGASRDIEIGEPAFLPARRRSHALAVAFEAMLRKLISRMQLTRDRVGTGRPI